jgi:hypothetical protein
VVTPAEREAVQFADAWGPWHAVRVDANDNATDTTYCGRNAIQARRMYVRWREIPEGGRCKTCTRNLADA